MGKKQGNNNKKEQGQSKTRAQRWITASGSGKKIAQKHLGHRDIKAMAQKKGITEDEAWKRASKQGITREQMGGYAAYKTGLHKPEKINDISEYRADMIGMVKKRGEDKGQIKNIYRGGDIKYLQDQGFGNKEIAEHINANAAKEGAKIGRTAQRFVNKWMNDRGLTPDSGTNPINPTNPTNPETPANPGTPTNPEPVAPPPPSGGNPGVPSNNANAEANANANQNVNSGNIDGDITIGDIDNTGGFIGQIGHTNNSVNINYNKANASANAIAGGANTGSGNGMESWSGPDNDPLANLMGGMAYQALNTNAWHRSQSELNGTQRAAQAVALNNTLTNNREIAAGYAQRAANGTDRMYRLAQNQWADTMGDTWRYQPRNWVMPEPPEEIDSNVEELTEEAYDRMDG